MSFNSALLHWITNQCTGVVVTLPQTSHRNSLVVVMPKPFFSIDDDTSCLSRVLASTGNKPRLPWSIPMLATAETSVTPTFRELTRRKGVSQAKSDKCLQRLRCAHGIVNEKCRLHSKCQIMRVYSACVRLQIQRRQRLREGHASPCLPVLPRP